MDLITVHCIPVFDPGEEACFLVRQVPDVPLDQHPATTAMHRMFRRRFKAGYWQIDSDHIAEFVGYCHGRACKPCLFANPVCGVWDLQRLYYLGYQIRFKGQNKAREDVDFEAEQAMSILCIEQWPTTRLVIETRFRIMIADTHPDHPGGDEAKARRAIEARDVLLRKLRD